MDTLIVYTAKYAFVISLVIAACVWLRLPSRQKTELLAWGALGGALAYILVKAAGALFGPAGALSTASASANLDTLGAVVTGVNDEPPTQAFPDDPVPYGPEQPVASVPLSAAALADQKARIARYVGAGPVDPRVAGLDAPAGAPARRPAFDASEGTPFDPLRNKTYDLNYAHAVPTLATY